LWRFECLAREQGAIFPPVIEGEQLEDG
jgi:hypothetical protein